MGIVYQHVRAANAAAWPIQGLNEHFRPEMERRIAERAGGAGEMLEAAE